MAEVGFQVVDAMEQSTNPMHHLPQDNQYILELGDHDVLCGRGSGPNDRRGNIEFRNLIMVRKVDYLSAPSRDAKGKIAKSIVETVRMRGGRFVRKLNAAEVEKAGFAKGTAAYEMADEPTGERYGVLISWNATESLLTFYYTVAKFSRRQSKLCAKTVPTM